MHTDDRMLEDHVVRGLSERLMMGGVPQTAVILLGVLLTLPLLLEMWSMLALPIVAFLALRRVYAHDEWAAEIWAESLRLSLSGATRFDP